LLSRCTKAEHGGIAAEGRCLQNACRRDDSAAPDSSSPSLGELTFAQ
jgi:hypothetical protein